MSEQKKTEESKTASAGHCFVTLCSKCGEVKRRKYRSDALRWVRRHQEANASHTKVEVVERAVKMQKPATKVAKAKRASKQKAEVQKEAAA